MILEVFNINSEYYEEMMNIILVSKVNPPEKGQIHHIIPRCWYKHYNLEVDNSISNTVLLTYENHKKVHKLAYKCAKEKWLKSKLACACHYFGDNEPKIHLDEETRKKISASNKGKSKPKVSIALKGRKLSEEHRQKLIDAHKKENLSSETIQKFRANAIKNKPRKGTITSEEARKNMSNAKIERYKIEENRLKCGRKFKGKTWVKINGKRVWRDK